jgi:hypothetical protein
MGAPSPLKSRSARLGSIENDLIPPPEFLKEASHAFAIFGLAADIGDRARAVDFGQQPLF